MKSTANLLLSKKYLKSVTSPTPATPSKQVEFDVKGIGCASCEPEVETAVGKLPGIHGLMTGYYTGMRPMEILALK